MTDWYVNTTTGNDSNDGLSLGNAKATLQGAFTAIGTRSGQTRIFLSGIDVPAGNYTYPLGESRDNMMFLICDGPDSGIDTTNLLSFGWFWGGCIRGKYTSNEPVGGTNYLAACDQFFFLDCEIDARTAASRDISFFNCTINIDNILSLNVASVINCYLRSHESSTSSINSIQTTQGTIERCCFKNTNISLAYDFCGAINHCSFWSDSNIQPFFIYPWNYGDTGQHIIQNCVAEGPAGMNFIGGYGAAATMAQVNNCYKFTCGGIVDEIDVVDGSRIITDLTGSPFADPANGDFTPSAELAALIGNDGTTPGAIHASSSGSSLTLAEEVRINNARRIASEQAEL